MDTLPVDHHTGCWFHFSHTFTTTVLSRASLVYHHSSFNKKLITLQLLPETLSVDQGQRGELGCEIDSG